MVLLLLKLNDFMLGGDDLQEGFRVVVVEVDGLLLSVFNHLLLNKLLDWRPCSIHVNGKVEDGNSAETISVNV